MPAQAPERPARAGPLRGVAALLGGALLLAALFILGRELIAAKVPQQRAALEEFIRHETGLEITFSRLSVRWGWYGPEAVFEAAALGEPDRPALLRAAQVVVVVDPWRSARSGQLEAGRIRLINPEIDLTDEGRSDAALLGGRRGAGAPALAQAPRWLARWRGGRIDIENGALRWPAGTQPLTVNVRRAQLRRLGAQWSAEAQLQLPDSLGGAAEFAARFSGDPAHPESLSGSLSFSGERLVFEGWRHFAPAPAAVYVPGRGAGNLQLQAAFRGGRLASLGGELEAHALEWAPRTALAVPLGLPVLHARWQLVPAGAGWRLGVQALELASPALHGTAQLSFAEGSGRATFADLPVGTLTALAHWWAPQAPLAQLALGGRARTLEIDWDARRPAGERWLALAELDGLTLGGASGEVALSGLSAHLRAQEARLTGEFTAAQARLLARRAAPLTLDDLKLQGHFAAALADGGWRLSAEDIELSAAAAHLAGRIAVAATAAAPARLEARVQLRDTDIPDLAALLGPGALKALGLGAAQVTAGRITSGEFDLHGALTAEGELRADTASQGTLELRDTALAAGDGWPGLEGLAARISWSGTQVRASVTAARSGALALSGAQAQWDAQGRHPLRASARLAGDARQVLAWLRERPQLGGSAPFVRDLDLEGDTQLDLDLMQPGSAAPRAPPRLRIAATLQGARLRALPGLPPLESLHGTLVFSAAHVQRAALAGRWLGGPVSLGVAEHREGADTGLTLTAHGLIEARQALLAANSADTGAPVLGAADWSAQLLLLPQDDPAQLQWRLHVDSSLAGVTSTLPEPFGKASATAPLPLHLDVQGRAAQAHLHLALGERLRAVALLTRSGESWRIERGALRLGAAVPELPGAPVVAFEGRVGRLDLPAYLALWQQVATAQTLPPVQARLSTPELFAGRVYGEAQVTATGAAGGAQVSVEAAQLHGVLHWPIGAEAAARPGRLQLASLEGSAEDAALAAQLPTLLGAAVELGVDDFRWQGHPLGRLHARLTAAAGQLQVRELHLSGAQQELRGSLECVPQARCAAHVSLRSTNLARTLADYGLRAEAGAQRAQLEGDLEWPQGSAAPLATASGDLHMQLEEGTTQVAAPGGEAFALLLVPGLLQGLAAQAEQPRESAQLRFAHLTADFALSEGVARTANLHLDGPDAEILVRARVNLLARSYDGEAFVLRGEERLPSALRGLGSAPRVAALWLSLRQWFTGSPPEDNGTALRLRGAWNDPIVTPVQ